MRYSSLDALGPVAADPAHQQHPPPRTVADPAEARSLITQRVARKKLTAPPEKLLRGYLRRRNSYVCLYRPLTAPPPLQRRIIALLDRPTSFQAQITNQRTSESFAPNQKSKLAHTTRSHDEDREKIPASALVQRRLECAMRRREPATELKSSQRLTNRADNDEARARRNRPGHSDPTLCNAHHQPTAMTQRTI